MPPRLEILPLREIESPGRRVVKKDVPGRLISPGLDRATLPAVEPEDWLPERRLEPITLRPVPDRETPGEVVRVLALLPKLGILRLPERVPMRSRMELADRLLFGAVITVGREPDEPAVAPGERVIVPGWRVTTRGADDRLAPGV